MGVSDTTPTPTEIAIANLRDLRTKVSDVHQPLVNDTLIQLGVDLNGEDREYQIGNLLLQKNAKTERMYTRAEAEAEVPQLVDLRRESAL